MYHGAGKWGMIAVFCNFLPHSIGGERFGDGHGSPRDPTGSEVDTSKEEARGVSTV